MTIKKWSLKYRKDVQLLSFARKWTSSREKVFIALDVEWDEKNPETILEIGMAILDLREGHLHPNRFPPSTWSIRVRHFIIRENIGVENSRHVRSNKFRFMFGKSYITSLSNAVDRVDLILDEYNDDEIVLVGHHMSQDLDRLREIGINTDYPHLDTSSLERAYSRRVNGYKYSLKNICENLEIPYYRPDKLHNGGNDAFFTMAIFSKMCCVED